MPSARTWETELSTITSVVEPDGRTVRSLLEEAHDLIRADARLAAPSPPGSATAGAARAGLSAALPPGWSQELEQILRATEDAHHVYLLAVDPSDAELVPRAQHVLAEIAAALQFVLGRAVDPDERAQWNRLSERHKADPDTPFALAVKLTDYAEVATRHRAALDALPNFEAQLVDELVDLAGELRQRGPAGQRSPEARAALHVRNRLVTLLQRKVAAVNSAVRFVFRNQPDILRGFYGPGR